MCVAEMGQELRDFDEAKATSRSLPSLPVRSERGTSPEQLAAGQPKRRAIHSPTSQMILARSSIWDIKTSTLWASAAEAAL